jgi:hypothetical protein
MSIDYPLKKCYNFLKYRDILSLYYNKYYKNKIFLTSGGM